MKYILTCLLLMLSAHLFSQEDKRTDSIYLFEYAFKELEASKSNGTLLQRNANNQVSHVSLIYDLQTGKFRKSQSAGKSEDISFNAAGIKEIRNFKLYGSFTYSRIKQQDLANSLKGEDIDDQPFYFFARKESDFSRQKYHANGIISYNLIKDKLYISSGFNYIYYLADRSIDPRMSLNWFDFKANPEITLKTKNFNFGLAGLLGYGNETTTIKYKRIDYAGGSLYPERMAYLNYGYGFIRKGARNFSRKKQYKGGGLHIAGELNSFNAALNIDYTNSFEKNQQSLDASLKNQIFSDYESQNIKAYLLLTRKHLHNTKQIEVFYSNLTGEDFLYDFAAKNYTAKSQNAFISYTDLQKSGNKAFSWGINGGFFYNYKKDAVTDHLLEYSYFQPGLNGALYYSSPKKYNLSATLSPSIILPTNATFQAPVTQEVEFTKSILYPDYAYLKATSGNLNLKINYINHTLSKDFRTGITLNSNFSQVLKKPDTQLPTYTNLGNNRLQLNLSLNLYF